MVKRNIRVSSTTSAFSAILLQRDVSPELAQTFGQLEVKVVLLTKDVAADDEAVGPDQSFQGLLCCVAPPQF